MWLELNRGLSTQRPNITRKGQAPADDFKDEKTSSRSISSTGSPLGLRRYSPGSRLAQH
jgi:hypothetical protein